MYYSLRVPYFHTVEYSPIAKGPRPASPYCTLIAKGLGFRERLYELDSNYQRPPARMRLQISRVV